MRILLGNIFILITINLVASTAINAYGVCTNPRNETGICIRLVDCKHFFNILTDAKNIDPADAKFLRESQCGQDNTQTTYGEKVLVCCPNNYRHTLESQKSVVQKSEGNMLPEPGVCGNYIADKIFGGTMTKIDEFPWMALLRYKTGPDRYRFYCGGSLINSRYVLTAGHCLKNPDLLASWQLHSVRLGEWNLPTNPDCVVDRLGTEDCADPHKDIFIDYVMVHPLYVPTSSDRFNDIALIRMAENVKYTEFISPICLPLTADLRSKRFTSFSVDVAGWGATERKAASPVKLKTMVDVWNVARCQNKYTKYDMVISEKSQLCAGGKNGTCHGDSGGPLMVMQRIKNRDAYLAIGILSYGTRPCGLEGWPSVYTRVGNYIDWIVNNLLP